MLILPLRKKILTNSMDANRLIFNWPSSNTINNLKKAEVVKYETLIRVLTFSHAPQLWDYRRQNALCVGVRSWELNQRKSSASLPAPRDQTARPLYAPLLRQFHLLAISCSVRRSMTYGSSLLVQSLGTSHQPHSHAELNTVPTAGDLKLKDHPASHSNKL
jgi:hypothetical protein